MHKIDQTRIGEHGNCFQASLASILELPLDSVPDFCNEYPDDWLDHFAQWLHDKHGLFPITVYGCSETFEWYANNCLCEGMVPSIDHPGLEHSVVINKGVIVHDPHPSKRSLKLTLKDVKEITLFVAVNPASIAR
jgi:hypothetical protein